MRGEPMHNQFANQFYGSRQWKQTRKAYWISKGGLCEHCLAKGLIVPGEQVHHKIELTPRNISDPAITCNPANLVLLCRRCHDEQHNVKRFRVDPATGAVEL